MPMSTNDRCRAGKEVGTAAPCPYRHRSGAVGVARPEAAYTRRGRPKPGARRSGGPKSRITDNSRTSLGMLDIVAHPDEPSAGTWAASRRNRAAASAAQTIPLLVILVLAVELRVLFQTGIGAEDSITYVHFARNLADGAAPAPTALQQWSIARIGLYGPVAVMYALFGVSELTTLAWPFLCSLLGVVWAYLVGRRLAGESAGLLSAFLWALLPTNVAAATALLGDGPIAALSIGAVYFLLVAESHRGFKRAAALTASFACLVVGILNKLVILLLVVFLVAYTVWKWPKNRVMWFWMTGIVATAVAGLWYYHTQMYETAGPVLLRTVANTATDWWSGAVIGQSELSWIAPLWIVAIAVSIALRRRETYLPLLWFWTVFLYLELGTRSPLAYVPMFVQPFGVARHFLLVAAPAVIVTAIYLAQGLSQARARWLTVLAALATGVVAWAGTRHATNLAWSIIGEAGTNLPFADVSAIATAVVVFGGIASPAVATGAHSLWKTASLGLLSGAIGLASLNPSYRAANDSRGPWLRTFDEALRFLEQEPPLPILVQNELFGQRLDYAAGFRLGFDSLLRKRGPDARIRVVPPDPNLVRDAFVLVDEYHLRMSSGLGWGGGPDYLRNPPGEMGTGRALRRP